MKDSFSWMGLSRVLVVGATGSVGKSVTLASGKLGHPSFVLVRDASPSDPAKAAMLDSFRKAGVTLLIRFIPSEFGNYADRKLKVLDDVFLDNKAKVVDAVKKSGVPYTLLVYGAGESWYLANLWQKDLKAPRGIRSPCLGRW